jgi:hypothetical protein
MLFDVGVLHKFYEDVVFIYMSFSRQLLLLIMQIWSKLLYYGAKIKEAFFSLSLANAILLIENTKSLGLVPNVS